jgi:hypothetical protein
MLFLAALLKRGGDTRYFWELADRSIILETPAGDDFESPDRHRVKARIKRATVRGWFRERFFATRQALADTVPLPFVIHPEGQELRKPRQWKPEELWMDRKRLEMAV